MWANFRISNTVPNTAAFIFFVSSSRFGWRICSRKRKPNPKFFGYPTLPQSERCSEIMRLFLLHLWILKYCKSRIDISMLLVLDVYLHLYSLDLVLFPGFCTICFIACCHLRAFTSLSLPLCQFPWFWSISVYHTISKHFSLKTHPNTKLTSI